ncbi:related to NADPH2:quinone reductase [Melanopsichium pennsylvanicum]|uniref:Probable quinone oxidoreductase n=2 Tax=Melanopsichium pennsylvanicum TaxID=63383 RepID=A0AAJ4XSS7_9BASI|nr:related to NADPH2:quinone reductase [Melanopsichium pennsylvanicum 4]SNX87207.1 related to NADPH2:quinone reductase [Melanopsichium pennsylvanicum]
MACRLGLLSRQFASLSSTTIISTPGSIVSRRMSTINALEIQSQGGPEVVSVIPISPPSLPGSKHVIIKNEYAGLNMIDTYHYGGLYPLQCPIIIGQESAGVIESVDPDVTLVKPGDRVVQYGGGSYTEKQLLPAERVVKLPDTITTKTAAASYLQGLTALTLLKEAHQVKKGDWLLVTAAAGGVGLLLCQLGRAFGARVIAVTSTPEKCALAKEHGAEYALQYNKENPDAYIAEIMSVTGGHGVDGILDGVGADTWEANFSIAARKGTIATFGNASGPVPAFAPLKLAAKNLKICRPTLFNYVTTREERERYSKELFDLVESGQVKINVHKEYEFSTNGMRAAFTDIKSRKTTGKLLVKIQ